VPREFVTPPAMAPGDRVAVLAPSSGGARDAYREALYDAVVEWVGRYNPDAPVVLGLDWGHTNPVAPLPVGRAVAVDPAEERVVVR